MPDADTRWIKHPDASAVAEAAVARILAAAKTAIDSRGVFRIVLAGGTTPQRAYEMLAHAETDWSRWQLYYGDERCLPVDDPQRNSHMVDTAWLKPIAPATPQHFPIPAESGPEQGALAYEEQIRQVLPFDLALLGLGEDGHTASLFPGHVHPEDTLVCPVHEAPKPPPDRISLGKAAFSQCRSILFLVTGSGKRGAISAWRSGEAIPAAQISCAAGVDVLIDEDALP